MKWNPFINAITASAYIFGIAKLFQFISSVRSNTPDTFLDPIVALSLLVFSVAVMGFLFFYRPAVLMLDNRKEEAVKYFFKTLGIFGLITILIVLSISLF